MPLITITSLPGHEVIYEGEGDLDFGPGRIGPSRSGGPEAVLRQRVNGYQRDIDLTGFLLGTRSQWCAEYAVPCVSSLRPEEALRHPGSIRPLRSEDETRLPDPPRPVRWTLELDVPAGQAQWLREKLGELPPSEPEGTPFSRLAALPGFSDVMRETMDHMRAGEPDLFRARDAFQALGCAAEEARRAVGLMTEAEVRRLHDERMAPEPDTSGEYDELIASTRAEFPPDPHGYGYPGDGPMRWTPPPEGVEVPSWP